MRYFSTYDSWKLDSGREHEDEEPRPERCSIHKVALTPDGYCEDCAEMDAEWDRERAES